VELRGRVQRRVPGPAAAGRSVDLLHGLEKSATESAVSDRPNESGAIEFTGVIAMRLCKSYGVESEVIGRVASGSHPVRR